MPITTRISIPLSKMNEQFIEELKKKYPGHVRLDIQVVETEKIPNFSEADFWKVIGMLDWSHEEEDDDAVLAPAVDYLSALEPAAILLFEDILAEKLFQLDKRAYAEQIGEDAYRPESAFSADNFLYARACVVANGKDFYEKVLADPTQMPKNLTFEPLLSLAGRAYQKKTGEEFDYFPTTMYETFSNPEGWEETLWDRIKE